PGSFKKHLPDSHPRGLLPAPQVGRLERLRPARVVVDDVLGPHRDEVPAVDRGAGGDDRAGEIPPSDRTALIELRQRGAGPVGVGAPRPVATVDAVEGGAEAPPPPARPVERGGGRGGRAGPRGPRRGGGGRGGRRPAPRPARSRSPPAAPPP